MITHWYTAFGLSIASALRLPELTEATEVSGDPDVAVRVTDLEVSDPGTKFHRIAPGEICFSSADSGTYLARDGAEILVDPDEDAAEATIRLSVLGPALGALLHQRGLLVLHGSAVSVDGRAIVLLGDSGAGKSTTAAALAARGHDILTDDLAVVRTDGDRPVLSPGFPALKLPERTVERFDVDWPMISATPSIGKHYYRTSRTAVTDPQPIHTVYLVDSGENHVIEPFEGTTSALSLVSNTYTVRVLPETDGAPRNVRQCAHLAERVRVCRLQRTDDFGRLEEFLTTLERDLATAP